MSIELREYQKECVEAVFQALQQSINRQLIILPTGSGKTIVMAAIAKLLNKKTLLLAHREELVTQAVDKFKLVWPEVDIGICMADSDEIHQQVVIASVQSASKPKRLARLKELGFEFMLIDEAHHAAADSYQSVITELGFNRQSDKLLVGVTATPHRSDKLGLDSTFNKITFSRSIGTMIKAGYLAPIIGRKILTSFTLERIRTHHGDFSISDLAEAVNTPERNAFIASKYKEYADNRKGIAFCCDVQHCKDLSKAFKSLGIESSAIWGDMESHERKSTLGAFKKGSIQVVTSCGILTEGYDEPSVNAIMMARPTKSQSLYIQCVGRGLRLWPGKQNCLVLDFTDRGHNLDNIMSLSCTMPEAFTNESELPKIDHEAVERTSIIECFEECDREFDILGNARFIWIPIGDNEWSLLDDNRHEIVMYPKEKGYAAALYFPDGSSQAIVKAHLPIDYCSGVCEDYARRNLKVDYADASKPWMAADTMPSSSQRDYLEKQGAYKKGMTRGQASIEIKKIIAFKNKQRRNTRLEAPTDKQKLFLAYHGIATKGLSKFQAMQAISKIKQREPVLR